MPVDMAAALKGTFHSHTYSFCSESCKETFDKMPERFADEATTP